MFWVASKDKTIFSQRVDTDYARLNNSQHAAPILTSGVAVPWPDKALVDVAPDSRERDCMSFRQELGGPFKRNSFPFARLGNPQKKKKNWPDQVSLASLLKGERKHPAVSELGNSESNCHAMN